MEFEMGDVVNVWNVYGVDIPWVIFKKAYQ